MKVPTAPAVRRDAFRDPHVALAFVGREAFPLVFVAVTALLVALRSADIFGQDTWLALVGGRIAAHGLPHHDTLAVWTHGASWVDQQWLGQLALYGLFRAGGIRLLTVAGVLSIALALAIGIAAARRRGASPVRAGLAAGAAIAVMVPDWELRTQLLAAPLFAALLFLLVAESTAPSRRAFLAVPLLVLWANVHGSVLLGALLVTGYVVLAASRARPPAENVALVAAAGLSIFASPYGFQLAGYYRRFLFNPGFGTYVIEWRATAPELATIPFFAALLAALWLLGRSRSLTTFEQGVVLLTAVAALAGVRNLLWFGLAGVVVLPRALQDAWPVRTRERAQANTALGVTAAVLLLAAVAVSAARPPHWLASRWPSSASAAVARAAAADRDTTVYADLRYADWLLLEAPGLRGRVAFDARLELLTKAQLHRISDVANAADDWTRALRGSRIVVLDPRTQGDTIKALARERGAASLYLSSWISVQALR